MNAKQLIIAVAALTVATAAFADQNETRVTSGKTRAEVIAELQQAQKDGTASSYSFVGNTNPAGVAAGNGAHRQTDNAIPTGKTRAEVVAELKQSGNSMPTSFVGFGRPSMVNTPAADTSNTTVAHK